MDKNNCLDVLTEIKTVANLSQRQSNQLALAIRNKAGVIPYLDGTAKTIADPCLNCKKLCDEVKLKADTGSNFQDLIRWVLRSDLHSA